MMNVEAMFLSTIDNQTTLVRVTEQMEKKNEAKIREMKEVIAEFVSPGPQGKIEVRCTPALASGPPKQQSLMSEYKQSNGQIANSQLPSIPQSCQASNEERITGPQIKLLRGTLKKHRISEREFCRQHQVDSIEAMPKHDAQWIIKDLIAEENKH